MEENTVVAFRNPSNFQDDPLTEVLRSGARELLAQAWKLKLPSFSKVMRCQRRSKSTPLADVKKHHLMRFRPSVGGCPGSP